VKGTGEKHSDSTAAWHANDHALQQAARSAAFLEAYAQRFQECASIKVQQQFPQLKFIPP
jgi:hypothetical protein